MEFAIDPRRSASISSAATSSPRPTGAMARGGTAHQPRDVDSRALVWVGDVVTSLSSRPDWP